MIFDKCGKITPKMKEKKVSSANGVGKFGSLYAEVEARPMLCTLYISISQWIRNVSLRFGIVKLLEGNGEGMWQSIGMGQPFRKEPRSTVNQSQNRQSWIQLAAVCTANETVNKLDRQLTGLEKTLASLAHDIGLIPRIYKNLNKLVNNETHNPVMTYEKMCFKGCNATGQQIHECVLRCLDSLSIRDVQRKAAMKSSLTPGRMAIFQTFKNSNFWWDVEEATQLATNWWFIVCVNDEILAN